MNLSRLLSEVEELASKLQSESDLLGRFYKELEELQLWASDTKSMIGSDGSHSNGVATSAQPLTSVAQLRGKHQVDILSFFYCCFSLSLSLSLPLSLSLSP